MERRPFVEQFLIAAAPALAEQFGLAARAWLRRYEARLAAETVAREAASKPRRR